MATTEPTHGYSVQIDRLTRDALWRGVQAELELASDSLKHRAGDGMGLNARLLARLRAAASCAAFATPCAITRPCRSAMTCATCLPSM
jgi:hypothetical protein